MSNFNEYFRSTGLKRMVTEFLDGIDSYSNSKITKLSYKIRDDLNYPANYYIENKLTAEFKVLIEYEQNGDGIIKESELSVPKEVEGAFIMNGAYRISTATLGRDFECRIYNQGTGGRGITFDYNRRFDFDRDTLLITNIDPNLGFINEKSLEIPINEIDNVSGDKKELLRLTEKQRKKFQIKLDLDYDPEFISERLIKDCIALGDDRVHDYIIDKTIDTVSSSFMQYLFTADKRKNFYTTKSKLRSNYTRYGRINMSYLTSLCNKYFRKGSAELQIPPGINPLNLDSFKSKIQINPSVAYNPTMSDLIDIADTPINGNTNLQNSLTVSTHVTDEGILFDVYDKNFNKITIDYTDYLNSKVVASEYVNYDTSEVVPNDEGKIEVKYRMRRKIVEKDDYDLIDLPPDYRLSSTSRRIPFINFTDSVRVSMGTSMLKQSIQLIHAERPLVDTGNNEDLSSNVISDKYPGTEGEVTEITDIDVVIKDDNGKTYKIPKRSYIPSINNISVYSEPKVKVGDRVKSGDVIVGGVTIEKDTAKVGLNANVLFHAYHGLINEDAVVVSESFADKMAHYSIVDLSINVKTNTAINWIAPIGTVVKFKDPIVKCKKTAILNEVNRIFRDKLGGIINEDKNVEDYLEPFDLVVPNNIEQAIVSDVKVSKNDPLIPKNVKAPDYTYAESSEEYTREYFKNNYDRKVIFDNYPKYIADDVIKDFEIDRDEYKLVYVVKVRLIVYNRLKVADLNWSEYMETYSIEQCELLEQL